MFNANMTTDLATAFAKYVQHHDPRAHALAQKADITELSDNEMDEMIIHMERAYRKFMNERATLFKKG